MNLVELKGVGRRYDMGDVAVHALKDVNLVIERGESVAIMGPSGSGKSTLLGILGCLDPPTTGIYRLAGEDTGGKRPAQLADLRCRRIGFVFQSFNLLVRLTAVENVELPLAYAGMAPSERRKQALSVLGLVGLADRVSHFPNQLSGGQQQRVAIARSLVNNPDMLLADEPTGALDTATGREILAMLNAVNKRGTAVVVVTHDPTVAANMRRTIALADGVIRSDRPNLPPAPSGAVAGTIGP
ncbi:MAG: ABC transporter ATP-binding protein [Hoeflea sp.]|uniref:ABC transporter ATP-binding protein n=1 Tax=Hoeflea sp. TaxID=1940281 RepID=UPI00272F42BE|nr:ABC transporter ATP-binding protein [Hoeflea sp.]MDP2120088.1 ABC transporter ATP-binding protein [Hoeflea sp.]